MTMATSWLKVRLSLSAIAEAQLWLAADPDTITSERVFIRLASTDFATPAPDTCY
jgi:hypothetical protein